MNTAFLVEFGVFLIASLLGLSEILIAQIVLGLTLVVRSIGVAHNLLLQFELPLPVMIQGYS